VFSTSLDMRSPFETPWILRDPTATSAERGAPVSCASLASSARTDPSLRVFCLPQAGCGAWSYHGWQNRLPPHVEVLPVEYPGRNSRLRHPFEYQSLQDLASAVVDAIEPLLPAGADASKDAASKSAAPPPYVLLGWSMGAWLGYEMVLEIARRGRSALPLRVYLGGARSPSLAGPEFDPDRETPALSALPEDLFWEAFARRYGANPDLEASEALRDLLLPTLRKDFALMERYEPSTELDARNENASRSSRVENAARLPVPLVAFGARGDARYEPAQLSAWRDVAPLDRVFLERWFEGPRATPHRLVLDRPADLFCFLNEAFAAINVVATKAVS
jgi:surfactin synthase thioesterase subunit